MLFDPKWNAPDYSLASLIRWLETKPRDGAYQWSQCDGTCLIGIYGIESGLDWYKCHTAFYERGELHVASRGPWTFGAALDRARDLEA